MSCFSGVYQSFSLLCVCLSAYLSRTACNAHGTFLTCFCHDAASHDCSIILSTKQLFYIAIQIEEILVMSVAMY